MAKWTLILFQITFATIAIFPQSTFSSEFSHLGSYRPHSTENNINFDVNDYYVSLGQETVTWSSAQQTCRLRFGNNSNLVSIETPEEWDFLKIMLEPHGIGATYWTSGMYDSGSRVWRWSANNIEIISSWAPWASGHPVSNPSGIHRILISHTNRNLASWMTVQNTLARRYICETPRNETVPPISCYDNDLIIVLDSSASIGSHNYNKAKIFASRLFENVTQNNSRIAFLIFNNTVTTIFRLNNTLSSVAINAEILGAPFLKGDTATHLAIREAVAEFISFPREAPRNLVVITDGESSNSALTAEAITLAVENRVRPFAVGISPSAVQEELLVIANGNRDYVFTTNICDGLISLLDPLTRKICSQ